MISFDTGAHRFNLRAAAIVLHGSKVLLHQLEGDDFWSAPGGRVEAGETAAQAIVRELREEVGVSVICGQLLWVVENFFTYHGSKHHEIGLYFQAQLPPESPLLRATQPIPGTESHVKLAYAWFERSRLADIEVRPTLLAAALNQPTLEFRHYVHHELDAP
jgi:8-oxo-dGTP pyrophosphatase MutT (NUDIX family)